MPPPCMHAVAYALYSKYLNFKPIPEIWLIPTFCCGCPDKKFQKIIFFKKDTRDRYCGRTIDQIVQTIMK